MKWVHLMLIYLIMVEWGTTASTRIPQVVHVLLRVDKRKTYQQESVMEIQSRLFDKVIFTF